MRLVSSFCPVPTIKHQLSNPFISLIDVDSSITCDYLSFLFLSTFSVTLCQKIIMADYSLLSRCLCSLSKIAGKGGYLVEYLVQIFFKHLLTPNFDNKQVILIAFISWTQELPMSLIVISLSGFFDCVALEYYKILYVTCC